MVLLKILLSFVFLFVPFACFFSYLSRDDVKITSPMAKRIARIQKLNINDFKKSKHYYRDIISQYSPPLLSYIDDFILDLPRDIVGIVMQLEKKGYIIVENGIFINEKFDTNNSNLTDIDIYILQHIIDGKLILNNNDIIKIVQQEGVKKNLFSRKEEKKKFFTPIDYVVSILGIIVFIFLFFFFIRRTSIILAILSSLSCSLFGILLMSIVSGMMSPFYQNEISQHPFFRTKLGNELNNKLEGLKLFLKDYGNMKDKEAESIILWEDYLIYSIIFHQNDIAIKKYIKYIQIN